MPLRNYPRQTRIPTQESPDLLTISSLNEQSTASLAGYSTNSFGFPVGSSSTIVNTKATGAIVDSTAISTTTRRHRQTTLDKTTSTTTAPVAALTTLTALNSHGLVFTVVGSIISATGTNSLGETIGSAVANARTTVPIAAAAASHITSSPVSSSGPSTDPVPSSRGLSSGDIAAAVVVPVVVVFIAALLVFFWLRRRHRSDNTRFASNSDPPHNVQRDANKSVASTMSEHKTRGIPFLVSRSQRNYNTGLGSSSPSNLSTSGTTIPNNVPGHGHVHSSKDASFMSDPFTDGSNRPGSDYKSDAFTGFSGAATETAHSSSNTTKGSNTPIRATSPSHGRAFSPIPESERATSHTADDDAVSEMSDSAEYHEGDVQVAEAHMGRSHRASVITMRAMGMEGSLPREFVPGK